MLTETFVTATQNVRPQSSHLSTTFKDTGIYVQELQPQVAVRHGFKKSSSPQNCLAVNDSHIFTAQSDKAVVNVYNREKGNQDATIPFPQKITSLEYVDIAAILIAGTQDGKLILWEVATGRTSTSSAAHLEAVSIIKTIHDKQIVLSASSDSSIHIWSLSDLVSFEPSQQSFNSSERLISPVATFSGHKAGITALTSGHSEFRTNFAVSTSQDKVCHVWHIKTCQILRTFLLAEVPQCLCMDPADRAFYVGSEEGNVVSCSLYDGNSSPVSPLNITKRTPKTLTKSENWKSSVADFGTVLCAALSYDGTSLLTGHENGTITRWDVGKKRVNSEIVSLPQAVTNIKMLRPDQLYTTKPFFALRSIVKPRLDFNTADNQGSSISVPENYIIHAQIVRSHTEYEHRVSDFESALLGDGIPVSMLDNAIQGMMKHRANGNVTTNNGVSSSQTNTPQVERMQDEITALKGQLSTLQKLEDQRYARHLERMEKRDAIGLEKRKAFFAAQEAGKDGDAAMKPFTERVRALDVESDEEALSARNSTTEPVDR